MYFNSKHPNSTYKPLRKLTLGDRGFDFADDYKYLGVTIDAKLTFMKHLINIIKTVSFKSSQLSKIRTCLITETSSLLYKTIILPIIDYGDIFLS